MANETSLRSYRDYDAYNRDGRSGQVVAGGEGDPLAELARIMARDDTYADVLKSIARTGAPASADAGGHDLGYAEPLDLPAMDLRGSAPLQAGEADWDDLEAELESYARQREGAGFDDAPQAFDDRAGSAPRGHADGWDGRSDAELERLLQDEFSRDAHESEPHWADAQDEPLTDEELEAHLARTLDRGGHDHDGASAHAAGMAGLAAGGLAAGGLAAGAAVAAWRTGAGRPSDAGMTAFAPHLAAHAETYETYGEDMAPPRRRRAGVAAILAVVGLAVAGGGGVLAYRAMTGGATVAGEPRVIRANADPVRVAVQPPAAAKPIADRVAEGERLVTREERPVTAREQDAQVQAPPASPRVIPLGAAPRARASESAVPPVRTVQAVPVTTETISRPAPAPAPLAAEAPRRVRTVAVGPDGQPVAPAQQVERAVPPPGGLPLSVVPTQSIQTRPVQVQVTPVQVTPAQVAPAQQAAAPVRAEAPALAAADSRTAPAPQPRPPVRMARAEPVAEAPARAPARGAAPLDLDPQRTASVRPQAPAAGGGTFVQISSHQSEAEARNAFAAAQRRFTMLQGQSANIRSAEIPGRGTWHRLRVGPFSRSDAASFCERFRSAGGSCVLN